MEFDFFLWTMLIPMLFPLFYCFTYKKESLAEVGTITMSMILIVIFYYPLETSKFLSTNTYTAVKILLFVLLPLLLLFIIKRKKFILNLEQFGIKREGLKKSVWLSILFLPIMLGITTIIYTFYINGTVFDVIAGLISFFEAFTEEFFFRGILFIYLLQRTNLKIAYITSLASFILVHPQHLFSIFIIGTIVQGILTIEICRRSDNLLGAWLLHGANRLFAIALLPFLLQ